MLIDNIIASADVANQEYRIFLCKMDKSVIRELTKSSFNKVYSPQLGGADEFSFSIPKFYDNLPVLNYDDIVGRNFIKIQQMNTVLGYFEIQSTQIQNDGLAEIKNIKCSSLEIKLVNKQLYLTTGTFKLVDNTNPSKGLLNIITTKSPSWSIGFVDSSLLSKERYFDITAVNVLEFLLTDIQTAYECVFVFNTVDNTINAYALSSFGRQSRLIVSMNNLGKSASIESLTNEVVTRLYLYGDNELSVYDVNLGQAFIQNFNYYKNTRYMSQGLINALNTYDAKVASYQTQYTNYVGQLTTLNAQLETYENDLLVLQNDLASLEKQKSYLASIQQSLVTINAQITAKNAEISSKQSQINSTNGQITSINNAINGIITQLQMSNNFTTAQIKELDQFVIEDTYQDSSYLITDSSTYQDKINVENALLNAGKNILARVSSPRYRIDMDVIDFLKVQEFSDMWNELYIGDIIRVDIDGFIVTVRVVGYTHDWDNNKLTIQFGDKYQLDDANIELLDLLKSSMSAGTSINFERYKYKDYTSNNKNEILEFINSSLDLAKNAVVGGTNQSISITDAGFFAKTWDSNINSFSPEQLAIVNNAIVLSRDGFNTVSTAIGKLANGQYGIAAEVVAGKMILGNNMIIETGNGDFIVDGNGVRITKMSLNMTSANNLSNIQLNPTNGIVVQSRPNVSAPWESKFYVDVNGNVQFKGNLQGATGTFSGSLTASTINGGTINGTNIFGGNITGTNIFGGEVNIGTSSKIRMFNYNNDGQIWFYNPSSVLTSSIKGGGIGGYSLFLNADDNGEIRIRTGGTLSLIGSNTVQIGGSSISFNTRPNVSGAYVLLEGDSISVSWNNITNKPFIPQGTEQNGLHNHGIPDGTVLLTDSGTVTWVESGNHFHYLY